MCLLLGIHLDFANEGESPESVSGNFWEKPTEKI